MGTACTVRLCALAFKHISTRGGGVVGVVARTFRCFLDFFFTHPHGMYPSAFYRVRVIHPPACDGTKKGGGKWGKVSCSHFFICLLVHLSIFCCSLSGSEAEGTKSGHKGWVDDPLGSLLLLLLLLIFFFLFWYNSNKKVDRQVY